MTAAQPDEFGGLCPVCGIDRSNQRFYTKFDWEREVLLPYRLPQRELLVAFVLGTYMHHEDGKAGTAYPSAESIAAGTGLSERSVRYAIKNLRAWGVLHSRKRTDRANALIHFAGVPHYPAEDQERHTAARRGAAFGDPGPARSHRTTGTERQPVRQEPADPEEAVRQECADREEKWSGTSQQWSGTSEQPVRHEPAAVRQDRAAEQPLEQPPTQQPDEEPVAARSAHSRPTRLDRHRARAAAEAEERHARAERLRLDWDGKHPQPGHALIVSSRDVGAWAHFRLRAS